MSPSSPPTKSPPSKALRFGVAGAVILMVAGATAFYYASRLAKERAPSDHGAITVTVGDKTCDPNVITVPAGRTTFKIVNQSKRAVEWEILDGVMVVEERENIAPGFTQTLTTKLVPGEFAITCGLLSNPRGVLHVTPSEASSAEAARPSTLAYVGPLAEYRVYLTLAANKLARESAAFVQAVKGGDLEGAKALYAPARATYGRLAAAADLFSDLDTRINARADYFEKRESDPAFTGFHRLEYALFDKQSTEGLAPIADRLTADITELQQRVRSLPVPPERLARGAARLMQAVADTKLSGEEDRYSHADLYGIEGNVEGATKVVDLLRPLLSKASADLVAKLDADAKAVADALARTRRGEGFAPFDTLPQADRQSLVEPIKAYAQSLSRINQALGLD